MGAADDGGVRRDGAYVVAGARIPVAGEIGLQEVAIGLGLALERPELDLGVA